MSKPTGKPRGRPRGAKNKHTKERLEKIERDAKEIAQTIGATAFEGDAHAFLMSVYKDQAQPLELRLDAAKAAVGYEKPKLSSVDANLSGEIGQYQAQPIPIEEREPIPHGRSN